MLFLEVHQEAKVVIITNKTRVKRDQIDTQISKFSILQKL